MSSNTMLKQAIIDADALREVALKNAESLVVQKYSNQIKEAVDTMLEQDDLMADPLADPMAMEDPMAAAEPPTGLPDARAAVSPEDEPETSLGDEIELAATDGDRLCPCPDDGESVEISFDALRNLMKTMDEEPPEEEGAAELGGDAGMPAPEGEEMAGPPPGEVLPPEEEEEIALQEDLDLDEEIMIELDGVLGELDMGMPDDVDAEEGAESGSEVDSAADGDDDPSEEEEEEALAANTDTAMAESIQKNKKVLKENTKLTKTNSKMLKENKQLLTEQKKILKQNKEMKTLLTKLAGKLEEVNLSNAKLIYTNQVLNGASLNERQKQRIVEAISSADSVDAAKSIFETLQSAVGSSLKSRDKSQSLSEAITRGNATTLRQKQKQTRQDPHIERMKKLAGI